MENKRKNLKKNQIVTFLVTVVIVVLVNVIGSFVFTRFDLTSPFAHDEGNPQRPQ